ncbi:MAG: hypothetical protein AAF384_18780 [Pseudomonadota bacterium]
MLPAAFADLEPLAAAGWCLGTETARVEKRHQSTRDELQAFYDTFTPRLEDVITYLDDFTLSEMPEPETNLMHLLLSMAEVTFAVEKFGADESTYEGLPAERFVPVYEHPAGGLHTPFEYK